MSIDGTGLGSWRKLAALGDERRVGPGVAQLATQIDAPYYGCERDYGDDTGKPLFARSEFEEMAQLLGSLKGTFLLSLNDHPDVRAIFAGFTIEAVETTYSIGGNDNAKRAGEVIISPR